MSVIHTLVVATKKGGPGADKVPPSAVERSCVHCAAVLLIAPTSIELAARPDYEVSFACGPCARILADRSIAYGQTPELKYLDTPWNAKPERKEWLDRLGAEPMVLGE